MKILKINLESKNVLIVAHGNSIRALLCILGVFSLEDINRFEIPTAKPMFIHRNPKDFFLKMIMFLFLDKF